MEPETIKRTYLIGDEWLYYKFYCGPKTADVLLTEMVKPIAEELLKHNVIDRWFFIRYSDPKLHIRVRFHVTNPQNIGPLILAINNKITYYIEQHLVWKVQVDTYQREIERYGSLTMEAAEQWFFHDSYMIADMLSMIEGDEGERVRWLFGLRCVDALLRDFGLDMEKRYEWCTRLREGFGREHNMNRNLKEQLEKKFRADRAEISELLDPANDEKSEMLPLFQMLNRKSQAVKPIVAQIQAYQKDGKLEMPLEDLLGSYSHMMINRLFKSKQRTHELVMYDFLHRYFKSEIGRQKYAKINAEKKAKAKDKKKKDKKK